MLQNVAIGKAYKTESPLNFVPFPAIDGVAIGGAITNDVNVSIPLIGNATLGPTAILNGAQRESAAAIARA